MKTKKYYTLAASLSLGVVSIGATPGLEVRFDGPRVVRPGQKGVEFIVTATNVSTDGELLDDVTIEVPLSEFYKLEQGTLAQDPDDFGLELSVKNGVFTALAPNGIALLNPGESVHFGALFNISPKASGVIEHSGTATATCDGFEFRGFAEPMRITVKGEPIAVPVDQEISPEAIIISQEPKVEASANDHDQNDAEGEGCRIDSANCDQPDEEEVEVQKPVAAVKPVTGVYKELSVQGIGTMPSVAGGQDGMITVITTDGQPPFTYGLVGQEPSKSAVIKGLAAGKYTVVVTDKSGKQKTVRVIIPRRVKTA